MQHNLQRLGPTGFQDLAGALAVAEFGSGVRVMGAGRDGGRDLYHRGSMIWHRSKDAPGEVWDGYTVIQVKHKRELSSRPLDDAVWLWSQIREELKDWSNATDRADVPGYLLVITNVPLSAVPESGGHDTVRRNIAEYVEKLADGSRDVDKAATAARQARLARLRRIKRFEIWDQTEVDTLLSVHKQVRQAFPGLLTAGDVFAALAGMTDTIPIGELEPALRTHARTTLVGEGFVHFDEAGASDGKGLPIHDVAIDLPSINPLGERSTVVRYVMNRAEHLLKPQLSMVAKPRHLIVTGSPGNGKTTVTRLLVQVFRAAMLDGAADLSEEHRLAITGYRAAMRRMGRDLPSNRRWAMRVDLAEYAEEGGLSEDSTLLTWIARKISKRSNAGTVKANVLHTWMMRWPWLLILDGLDEITDPLIRKRLILQVTEFVTEAEGDDCDVLVVLTTRPIGYTENIAPTQFERIDLDDLPLDAAVRYGELATQVRLKDDLDRIERVTKRLRKAAQDESLVNLLRTPLQVLILTIIIDGAGTLAPDRYSLFWNYYDTVFRRELNKPGQLRRLLQDHGQQIQLLHQAVGFELQVRSESGDRSYATLTAQELRDVIWRVLHDAEFDPSGRHARLLEDIFTAATQRLVLLSPRGASGGYGFDVRSLQELMAAMHLTSGPLEMVRPRLKLAVANPHWRNTWIFAAGRLFAIPQEHQHQAVVELVESADQDASHRLGTTLPIGPRLALEIVDDGMARQLPKWRNRIVANGLRLLAEPAVEDFASFARILVRFADSGEEPRLAVAEGLRDALGGNSVARGTARRFQGMVPALVRELQTDPRVRGLVAVKRRPGGTLPTEPRKDWENFDAEIATYPVTDENRPGLGQAAAALRRVAHAEKPSAVDIKLIVDALPGGNARALDAALTHVMAQELGLLKALREQVLPTVLRQPVGDELRT